MQQREHNLPHPALIHSFPGYVRLRMHTKGGSPVAFVEFSDVRFANAALTSLQGFVLASSDRGGIRIEYAKNKMGEVGTYLCLPPQVKFSLCLIVTLRRVKNCLLCLTVTVFVGIREVVITMHN